MNTSTKLTFNAGVGGFLNCDYTKQNSFVLNNPYWLTIQAYCRNVAALPSSQLELRKRLGNFNQRNKKDFQQLVGLFSELQEKGNYFCGELLPEILGLAENVHSYANMAALHYSSIINFSSDSLEKGDFSDSDKKTLQVTLLDTIEELHQNSVAFCQRAEQVQSKFVQLVSTFQQQLPKLGSEHPLPWGSGYWQYFNNEYGQQSPEVRAFVSELSTNNLELNQLQQEYNKTTAQEGKKPSYTWVWPVGVLATSIVSGSYTDLDEKKLSNKPLVSSAHKLQLLSDSKRADARLMGFLNLATGNLHTVNKTLNNAVGVLRKLHQSWLDVVEELANFKLLLTQDIEQSLGVIKSTDFVSASVEWHDLAVQTLTFQTNTEISVSSYPKQPYLEQ